MLSTIAAAIDLSSGERKTLLTPGFVHPGLLKRALALTHGSVANLAIASWRAFVVSSAAPLFPGMVYATRDRAFWMLSSHLSSLGERLHYFGEALVFDGVCSSLLSTIEELRLNDITATHLDHLPNRKKWQDVRLIMQEYDGIRKSAGVFDYADCVAALRGRIPGHSLTFLVEHPVSSGEQALIREAGITVITQDHAGVMGGVLPSCTLSGYKVDTPYQEALQTIRNIMADPAAGEAPVSIGICAPNYPEMVGHMSGILEAMGLPDMVHFAGGMPVFATSAGRLWQYLAEWVGNSFSVYRFLRVLACPAFDRGTIPADRFFRAVRVIRNSGLVLLDNRFADALVSAAKHTDDDEEDTEPDLAPTLRALVREAAAVTGAATPLEQLAALRDMFSGRVRVRNESDARAAMRIEVTVDTVVGASGGTTKSIRDLVAMINNALGEARIPGSVPDFTRPVLGTPDDLAGLEFDALYILGMQEQRFPGAISQNPVLLDVEKRSLRAAVPSAWLPVSEDILHDQEVAFGRLLRSARNRVTLSAPLRDLATGRERLVARFLPDVWNATFGTQEDYRTLAHSLGDDPRSKNNHVAADPQETVYPYELAVSLAVHHAGATCMNTLLTRAFPFATAVRDYRAHRRSTFSFDQYWGILSPVTPAERVTSASRLKTWTTCPYQYLLKYELRLEGETDFDSGVLEWLDPLAYGSFLHDLYYRFFIRARKTKGNGFTTVTTTDRGLLRKEYEKLLDEYRQQYPVSSQPHFEQTIRRLESDISHFLEREIKNRDERMFVELAFGMAGHEGREPLLHREEPPGIVLEDGRSVRVRGAIDRVDRRQDGQFLLIDYKTGSKRPHEAGQIFGGGEYMQAGLYSEVAGQISPEIHAPLFRFYFAAGKGGFQEYDVDYAMHRDRFLRFLDGIFNQMDAGNYVPVVENPETFPCGYCDFKAVCIDGRRWLIERIDRRTDAHYGSWATLIEGEGTA